MISAIQARMARAALRVSAESVSNHLGVSRMTLNNVECDEMSRVSVDFMLRLESYYTDRSVFFGPKDAVCVKEDFFLEQSMLIGIITSMMTSEGPL